MPRLGEIITSKFPTDDNFVGRIGERQEFRSSIRYIMGKDEPPSNISLFPRIFLPYGEGGTGKTSLLQQFEKISIEEGVMYDRIFYINLDFADFPSQESLGKFICDSIQKKNNKFGQNFNAATRRKTTLQNTYQSLRKQWNRGEYLGEEKLNEIYTIYKKNLATIEIKKARYGIDEPISILNEEAHIQNKIEEIIDLIKYVESGGDMNDGIRPFLRFSLGEDIELFEESYKLSTALSEDFFELAESSQNPLVVMIDTYERADQFDNWVREGILNVNLISSNLVFVIGGRNKLDEKYKRLFSGIYRTYFKSINLNREVLIFEEIKEFLQKQIKKETIEISDSLISEVLSISRGIPVAVEALANQLTIGTSIEKYKDLSVQNLNRRQVVQEVVKRFLRYAFEDNGGDETLMKNKIKERQRIKSMSILLRPDLKLLSKLWGIKIQETIEYLSELARKYSFIFQDTSNFPMHDLVKSFVREDTYKGRIYNQTIDWEEMNVRIKMAINEINYRLESIENDVISHDPQNELIDLFESEDWCQSILDKLNLLFWNGNHREAQNTLLNNWIKARYFNEYLCEELLKIAKELSPNSSEWKQIFYLIELEEVNYPGFLDYEQHLDQKTLSILFYLISQQNKTWDVSDYKDLKRSNENLKLLEKSLNVFPKWDALKNELASIYYNKAKFYFDELKKPDKSLQNINKAIELKQDRASYYTGRGAALSVLGNQESAIKDWKVSLEIRPNNKETLENLINILLSIGKEEDALKYIDNLLKVDENNILALEILADTKVRLGEIENALDIYNKILEVDNSNLDSLRNKAQQLWAIGETKHAKLVFDKLEHEVLQLEKEEYHTAVVKFNKAIIYQYRGEIHKAFDLFTELVEIEPNNSAYLWHRAFLNELKCHFNAALVDYFSLTKFAPEFENINNIAPIVSIANIKYQLGGIDESIRYYNNLDSILNQNQSNKDFSFKITKGILLLFNNDLEIAELHFGKLIEEHPAHIDVILNLAYIKFRRCDFSASSSIFRTEVQKNQLNTFVLFVWFLAELRIKKLKKLSSIVSNLRSINPETPFTYSCLGLLEGMKGNFVEGETFIIKSVEFMPGNPWLNYNAAVFYYSYKKNDEAKTLLRKSLALDQNLQYFYIKDPLLSNLII